MPTPESEMLLTEEPSQRLEEFFRSLAAAPARALLLLDYDGTLSAFRVDRFKARPWAGVQPLLRRIQATGRTRLAVITGRPACEIAPMLQLTPPLEVWGLHGAERLSPDGRRELQTAPAESQQKLDALRAQLQQDALGGLYEDKANAAVLHWRGFSREQAEAIRSRTMTLFEPLAQLEGLRLLHFDGGVELRGGRDKGGAVEAILQEEAVGTPVAYLGDDLSDEAAFRALQHVQGAHLSVLVRRQPRATAADVWLQPPSELRQFLTRWAECVEKP